MRKQENKYTLVNGKLVKYDFLIEKNIKRIYYIVQRRILKRGIL